MSNNKKKKAQPQTFEEAAAELGEARPLDDVLRQLVKPEKKKEPNAEEPTAPGAHEPGDQD